MSIIRRSNGSIEYSNQPSILNLKGQNGYQSYFPTEDASGVTFNTNTLRLDKGDYDFHIDLQSATVDDAYDEIENRLSLGGRSFTEINYTIPAGYVYAGCVYYKEYYVSLYYNEALNSTILVNSSDGIQFATANTISNILFGAICVFNNVVYLLGCNSDRDEAYLYQLTNPSSCQATLFDTWDIEGLSNLSVQRCYLATSRIFMCGTLGYNTVDIAMKYYTLNGTTTIEAVDTTFQTSTPVQPQFVSDNVLFYLRNGLLRWESIDYDGAAYIITGTTGIHGTNLLNKIGGQALSNYDPLNNCYYVVDNQVVWKVFGITDLTANYIITDNNINDDYEFIYCNGRYVYNIYDTSSGTSKCLYGQKPYNNTVPTNGQYIANQAMKKLSIQHDKLYAVGANDGKVYYSLIR